MLGLFDVLKRHGIGFRRCSGNSSLPFNVGLGIVILYGPLEFAAFRHVFVNCPHRSIWCLVWGLGTYRLTGSFEDALCFLMRFYLFLIETFTARHKNLLKIST